MNNWDPLWPHTEDQVAIEEQAKSDRRFSEMVAKLFKLIGIFLLTCLIYSSSLVTAYFIVKGMTFYQEGSRWEKLACILIGAYLITCVLFYIKGIMIALKINKKRIWYLLWAICFIYVCLLPAVVIYFFLEVSLAPTPAGHGGISHYQFWSGAAALIAGITIYNRYDLAKDKTLAIAAWAYKNGLATGFSLSAQ